MADNKQMKTLGGYEVVDEKAREEISAVEEKADEALSLAKGATRAFVYDTYEDMISELNQLDKAELLVNYHIMIRTVYVPDLWVSGISDEHVEYTYTSNEDFIADLTEDGIVQVGYFILSALETQKVELDEYVKKDDYAQPTVGGTVKVFGGQHGLNNPNGILTIMGASQSEIDAKKHVYKPITPIYLDYAVMKALSDSKLEWTEEQKQLARALLGSVGSEDYANSDNAGVVRVHTGAGHGLYMIGDEVIAIYAARADQIDKKIDMFKPITPSNLDYAVKKALSDCKLEGDDVWTDEEKAKALELLGIIFSEFGTPIANRVVKTGAGGQVTVGTPTMYNSATPKKYVDDLVGDIETSLDTIIAIQESLVGGEIV